MTLRSVILGLLGAVTVCAYTYFNDFILSQTMFIGNNMPVSVYGMLILFVILVNARLRRWALTGKELAVIMALVLSACCIPGSGLLRTFTVSLVMPHHFVQTQPGWSKYEILDTVPERMLVDVSGDDTDVVAGFVQGMGVGQQHIAFGDVPWHAWGTTLLFWIPIILCLWFAMVGLSLVFHRQWSQHEHLPYPIAMFTNAMLPEEGKSVPALFRNRLFWIGLGVVGFIHLNNYLCQWVPDWIPVRTSFEFWPLRTIFPIINEGGGWWFFRPTIYFTVIAIAYFIPSDISVAFSLGPLLWAILSGVLARYGINPNAVVEGSSWYTGMKPATFALFGATLGVFFSLLYTGRHYYVATFKRCFGLPGAKGTDPAGVWGARVFLAMIVLFMAQLVSTGLDWQLTLLYTGTLVVFFTVVSRVVAETGLFHIQLNVFPCVIIWGFLGNQAVGPTTLLLMQIISMVLVIDPRESLMPFMVNSLKLLEYRKEGVGRVCGASMIAIVIGLAVALPLTMYFQYDRGSALPDRWAYDHVPKMPFDNAVAMKQKLIAQDVIESSESVTGWERFTTMAPNGPCTFAFVAGLALVAICSTGRLRFPWWPIHPLMFVLWSTNHVKHFAWPFFIGWVVKLCVLKYGGTQSYNRTKPLMIGLIAGEVLGAVIPSIVGAIYYCVTGEIPPSFRILPG